jgi:hypothetical protein
MTAIDRNHIPPQQFTPTTLAPLLSRPLYAQHLLPAAGLLPTIAAGDEVLDCITDERL